MNNFPKMNTFIPVATVTELEQAKDKRMHLTISKRNVTVASHKSKVFCFDSVCFHMGGPFGNGDIEDYFDDTIITCPWHAYKISIMDGAKYHKPVTFDPRTKSPIAHSWEKATECSQRIHEARVDDQGTIHIRLNSCEQEIQSDHYAFNPLASSCLLKSRKQSVHSKHH